MGDASTPRQCKDIDDAAVLTFLAQHQGRWSTWDEGYGYMPTVRDAMPPKLQLAKMRQLNGDGYEWGNPLRVALRERIREETERLLARPREPRGKMSAMHLDSYLSQVKWANGVTPGLDPLALSGVALGIDQDACGEWYRMGLSYVGVIP